jgi:flagellin-specific chaperone FliS
MIGQGHTYGAKAKTQGRKLNPYLAKEIMEAPQEKLLLKTYDFALVHCKKGDVNKTVQAIDILIESLDLNYEIAKELYSLYLFCKEQMMEGNGEIVYEILTSLKEAWITAFNKAKIAV